MPRSIPSRASTENLTSLADISVTPQKKRILVLNETTRRPMTWKTLSRGLPACFGLDQDPHDVTFLHDEKFVIMDLHLGAGPLREQHQVADLEVYRKELAALIASTRTNGDNLALLGLFLGGVRNDDASGALCLGFDTLDHDTIVKRTEFHEVLPIRRSDAL